MNGGRARAWLAATAIAVLVGLVVQVPVSANGSEGAFFHTATARAFNVFAFFTVQSNVIVGVTSLLLALAPNRSSTRFRVLRLTGVVAIAITGIVYHAVLAQLLDLESWALVADTALHTVVPIMAIVGWLMFGPRGIADARTAGLSVIFPICWLLFTLIRGEIVGFYPYPFVDVGRLGYGRVIVNCVWVAVLYFGVASGAVILDRWLSRLREVVAARASSD